MSRRRVSWLHIALFLTTCVSLLGAAMWRLAAQVKYARVTQADVTAMRPAHYFTADAKYYPAQFEWSFSESEFQLRNERGAIPKELIEKLLPAGATAEEVRGKWKLTQADGQTGQLLVLTEIAAGDIRGKKEVRLPISRTAPGVIRVGDPEIVFARDRNNLPDVPEARPGITRFELQSGAIHPGLALRENQRPVHWVTLTADIDARGEGRGTLTLDPTPPEFDEFGDPLTGTEVELPVKPREALPVEEIKCRLELVKTGTVERVNAESLVWTLYRVKSPKLKQVLFLATSSAYGQPRGRLLLQVPEEKRVERVIELRDARPEPPPVPPCHPGCFPAGTRVLVPGGVALIDRLRAGDVVMTVTGGGTARPAAVSQVFTTRNQLVELRTSGGSLVATRTQPVCVVGGGFRETGKLKAGDRLWRWREGRREEVAVEKIVPTGRQEPVFNLIVGESAVFVADDFLVRGKPPAVASIPVGHTD